MKILSLKEVIAEITLSKATIYKSIKLKTFPKPIRLSARRVGWLASDIEAYVSETAKARDEEVTNEQ